MASVSGFPSTASLKRSLADLERLLPFGVKGQLGLGATGSWALLHLSPSALACRDPLRGKAEESLCMG